MGAGIGLMMPAMFAQYFSGAQAGASKTSPANNAVAETFPCPECRKDIPVDAKFCLYCGHQQLVFRQCAKCGKNMTPNAKFCSRCGSPAEDRPKSWSCLKCGNENLAEAVFCNECGEKH